MKEVVLTDDVTGVADEVLTVVPAAIGPRLGEQTQKVIAAVKRGEWSLRDRRRDRSRGRSPSRFASTP